VEFYKYYLGQNSDPWQNREFQAYWMQLETEWLRSNPNAAGVLAFCYLANNYGYTGDWFIDNIKDLKPSPTLDWFQSAFAPVAAFINLTDERYMKSSQPHQPGSTLLFSLAGINNHNTSVKGHVKVKMVAQNGGISSEKSLAVQLEPGRTDIPVSLTLPDTPGGYVLVAEFSQESGTPVTSRRFLKIGQADNYKYFNLNPLSK
jgi:hypothetical protein